VAAFAISASVAGSIASPLPSASGLASSWAGTESACLDSSSLGASEAAGYSASDGAAFG